MELTSEVKRLVFKFSFISLTFCVLLWFSIFSYGLLYYLYIPSIAHIKPVHLRYDSRCSRDKNCFFPHNNITLVEKGQHELLSGGQAYAIELAMDMPESENNINQGMFMVHLGMLSQTGEVLQSTRRPVMLHYRSPLFKIIYTLFFVPALLAGTLEEKQSFSVPLFEKFVENCNQPTFYAFVEIESTAVEVYSCSLRIHAQFTGLRYMMYYWPTLSAVVGVGTNFFFISIIVIFIWIRQIVNTSQYTNVSALTESEQELVNEIRESMQRSRAQKPSDEDDDIVDEVAESDIENVEVEDISPHDSSATSNISRSSRWYREKGSPNLSATKNVPINDPVPSTSRQVDQLSEEIENITNLNPEAEMTTSPRLRKRLVAE